MMFPSIDEVDAYRAYLDEQAKDPKWFRFDVAVLSIVAALILLCSCSDVTAPAPRRIPPPRDIHPWMLTHVPRIAP